MAIFNRGRHSINKKYERFSDVHKKSTKYRTGSRSSRATMPDADPASGSFVLPTRREIYGGKNVSMSRRLRFIPFASLAVRAYALFRERMRRIRETRASALLGYIPMKLFIGLSVITLGLYPYTWIWGNAYAFNKVGGRRVDEHYIKVLSVIGFCVQLLIPASVAAYLAWRVTGVPEIYELSIRIAGIMAILYFALVLPVRCFSYFNLRWAIRSAVIDWDSEGVMVGRTITSWFKLFIFGSLYIQHHINRLMGLGMPGFADVSEIEMDISFSEMIDKYVVIGKSDQSAASWTKDDWKSEYGEEDEGEGEDG
ncbi:MAG: hypothetical protein LBT23_05475 [Synergistaceae bacterium]|jgi:hypothetical protein|nr:hypothetical protein [Synergistaceae bacterium]